MMTEPKLEDLLEIVDTKYSLSILAAKRAREINDYVGGLRRPDVLQGVGPLIESESSKPLTIALEEIAQGKLGYERREEGIK